MALETVGKDYIVNPGDGAFYGPKIDFHLKDCLGRTWQCGTIQLDFQMPEKFDMSYIGEDGEKHRPVMVHRTVFGSIERFIGILTEHFGGAFPTWMAPVQAMIIPITSDNAAYADELAAALKVTACVWKWITATKKWATRSAKPRCRRSHTCLLLAARKRKMARFPCVPTRTATKA